MRRQASKTVFKEAKAKNTALGLPANRSIVVGGNFLLYSGVSFNIIGRDEITEKSGKQCGTFRG